jgi:hypothetical protein
MQVAPGEQHSIFSPSAFLCRSCLYWCRSPDSRLRDVAGDLGELPLRVGDVAHPVGPGLVAGEAGGLLGDLGQGLLEAAVGLEVEAVDGQAPDLDGLAVEVLGGRVGRQPGRVVPVVLALDEPDVDAGLDQEVYLVQEEGDRLGPVALAVEHVAEEEDGADALAEGAGHELLERKELVPRRRRRWASAQAAAANLAMVSSGGPAK